MIGLGSNLGSREATLRAAIALLGLEVVATSRLYRTPPLGPPQPEFSNAAVRVRTDLPPGALLAELQRVEAQLGRVRRVRWGPRTIDLDLLWWEGGVVDEPGLTVPHPGLLDRAFALAPLLDVAPELPFAARLAALEPVTARPWTNATIDEHSVEARALDDADALALALGAALGAARAPDEVHPIERSAPAELVRDAARIAGARPALVMLESLAPGAVRARVLLDSKENRAVPEPALGHLASGACRITLGRPTR